MYTFKVTYFNMNTNDNRTETIEIEEQFFDTEKEIYSYAMSRAYEGKRKNESFDKIEFISC